LILDLNPTKLTINKEGEKLIKPDQTESIKKLEGVYCVLLSRYTQWVFARIMYH